MNLKTMSIIALIFALIIPAVGAIVTYSVMDEEERPEDEKVDTGQLAQQLSTLTHAKLSGMEESTLDEIEEVVSRDTIVETVWPEEEAMGISEQAIDALVRRLRDRISAVDPDHAYIVTVRGHGFRLDNR